MVNARGGLLTLATLWGLPTASCLSSEVSQQTSLTVSASSYDTRPLLEGGCYTDGCKPDLTIDRLETDVDQSRWSCAATETEPCFITYTFGETRMVESLILYFTNVTEDIPVIISTKESSADEEYVAQIVETVSWSYRSVVSLDVDLQPVPLGTAVRIEADLPAGGWVSLLEAYIYVTLEDDEEEVASSGGSSAGGALIGSLVVAIFFCGCGFYIYHRCCGGWGGHASASSSSSSSSATAINVAVTQQGPTFVQGPAYAHPA